MNFKKHNKSMIGRRASWLSGMVGAIGALGLIPSAEAALYHFARPQLHCDTSGHCTALFDRNDAAADRLCSATTAAMVWQKGASTYLLQCIDETGGGDNANYLVTVSDAAVSKFSVVALDYGRYLPPSLLMAPVTAASHTAVAKTVAAATASAASEVASEATGNTVSSGSGISAVSAVPATSSGSGVSGTVSAPGASAGKKNAMLPFCTPVDPGKVKASNFVLMNRLPAVGKNAYCYAPTYLSLHDGEWTIETAEGPVQAGDSDYFGPSISPAARKDIQAMLREVRKAERR